MLLYPTNESVLFNYCLVIKHLLLCKI